LGSAFEDFFLRQFRNTYMGKRGNMSHPFQRTQVRAVAWGFAALVILFGACAPAPRKVLTKDQKQADLMWLFSQFDENYAPLEYKAGKLGFNYTDLKAKYLKDADATATNEQFYRLMSKFVSEFQDAHTSTTQNFSFLPKRSNIAYLGFDGIRKGDGLLVTALLPSYVMAPNYPVKLGDTILKMDGQSLPDLVKAMAVERQHLGNPESNLTAHMPKLFSKTTGNDALPAADASAKLTIRRGFSTLDVVVPWITKDMQDFLREQQQFTKKEVSVGATEHLGLTLEKFFQFALAGFSDQAKVKPGVIDQLLRTSKDYQFYKSFVYVDKSPTWGSAMVAETLQQSFATPPTSVEKLKMKRFVPASAVFVNANAVYPTYVTGEKVFGVDGKATGETKLVATMYLDTFSPSGAEPAVLKEVSDTLYALQTLGVKDLVIDMIDNGGGSLSLGLQMAQLFSNQRIIMPEMQFKLSNTWIDEFESGSIKGGNDAERELFRRVYDGLSKDLESGLNLSSKWSTEALMPFAVKPNDRLKNSMNVVLLVNEMCASMCDIFSAVMQDNKLATVVGAQTMGAGGNVVMHGEAPNSHMWVSQTESLILRKDGSYIENNGIKPDVALPVNEFSDMRYMPVRAVAVQLLTVKTP
jgi:C-terminal processing protease CtpA/Prc